MALNIFNSVKQNRPNSNSFDLSHDVKMSLDMGNLTPTLILECVPGDKFNIGCESLLRFAPLVSPVMHRMDVTMHYFFVPNRILWEGWEDFITNTRSVEGELPGFPTVTIDDQPGSYTPLCDYLGIPTPPTGAHPAIVSGLPFAAYQAVYNEYYRDQNLIAEVDYKLPDGEIPEPQASQLKIMRKRAWEHDYFTAALPFAQKGQAVDIPLGQVSGESQVIFNNASNTTIQGDPIDVQIDNEENPNIANDAMYIKGDGLQVGSTTVNDLRIAIRLQEWLEKAARGGSRYIENILSHFGVRSSDKRLNRPEYIVGTKSPVTISEVLSTAQTEENPQGNMAGHAVSVTSSKNGFYSCEEHGYIIGIMSVIPKTAYQQGIAKTWLKDEPTDFYWPSFAHLGEQEVLMQELFAYTPNGPNETFGYIPRYSEYKYMPSRVAGDFKNSLDFWHLGRIFDTEPALNQAFIECVPSNRIFAVTDSEVNHLYAHVFHQIRAYRPMPKFGTPTF